MTERGPQGMLKPEPAAGAAERKGGDPMPEEPLEDRTKRALDAALRQLLEEKPLDQIRVRELTALCGIRRQSFYYHFPDVYALFAWSLARETEGLLARQAQCLTWQQALRTLLVRLAQNRPYYRALLEHRGRAGLREVLALGGLLERTLDYYRRRSGGPRPGPAELDCWETLLLTLLESWVRDELAQPPETLLALLEDVVRQGAVGAAWQNLGSR